MNVFCRPYTTQHLAPDPVHTLVTTATFFLDISLFFDLPPAVVKSRNKSYIASTLRHGCTLALLPLSGPTHASPRRRCSAGGCITKSGTHESNWSLGTLLSARVWRRGGGGGGPPLPASHTLSLSLNTPSQAPDTRAHPPPTERNLTLPAEWDYVSSCAPPLRYGFCITL